MKKAKIKTINFEKTDNRTRYRYLTTAIAPRPIAFASTVNREGLVNLSPFSYFNVFSSTPPVMVFSPSRSGRDNTTKNTYDNIKEVPEVAINIVNYPMVEQMSLASGAYESGVNEFKKAGFTEVKSDTIKPPRVKESPVSFECVVDDVIELGKEGGAGNLVIARARIAHINEDYLDENGSLNQVKLSLVARMGGNWYCHANEKSMFEIPKPGSDVGMGVDRLPEPIRNSHILSGSDIGRLGGLKSLPSDDEVKKASEISEVKKIIENHAGDIKTGRAELQRFGKLLIEEGKVAGALAVMMVSINPKKQAGIDS